MNCSHCHNKLIHYKKSVEIPNRPNWYYITCSCGNVMKAKIVGNSINVIQNTTTKKGFSTRKEISLALQLFKNAGLAVQGYSVNNPDSADVKNTENKSLITKAVDLYKTVF